MPLTRTSEEVVHAGNLWVDGQLRAGLAAILRTVRSLRTNEFGYFVGVGVAYLLSEGSMQTHDPLNSWAFMITNVSLQRAFLLPATGSVSLSSSRALVCPRREGQAP
jgi:hypothetical protein